MRPIETIASGYSLAGVHIFAHLLLTITFSFIAGIVQSMPVPPPGFKKEEVTSVKKEMLRTVAFLERDKTLFSARMPV